MKIKRMTMLTMLVALMAGCGGAADEPAATTGATWLTDFGEAKRLATEQKKPILMDFSGSDWCGWCIKLDREVFSKEAFAAYAKDNLVLFLADFPKTKELPANTATQNKELAEKYGVRGFPSVLLVDAEGRVLAETGYRPGGAAAYVAHVKELLHK